MIVIIDYGMGNLGSIQNMLKKIGYDSIISSKSNDILNAKKIILPGVGLYSQAIHNLKELGLDKIIIKKVSKNTPLLGICLGMQLLSSFSEEGFAEGLDIIKGKVKKFDLDNKYKIPHMGWNMVDFNSKNVLFNGFENLEDVRFYFVHSFYYETSCSSNIIAQAEYGVKFTCAINKGNFYGVQFHPEKSHKFGKKLLENFCKITDA